MHVLDEIIKSMTNSQIIPSDYILDLQKQGHEARKNKRRNCECECCKGINNAKV